MARKAARVAYSRRRRAYGRHRLATALSIDRFRQNAIENGREGLQSAVLLLTRHFDRQFDDFSVLQKSIAAELESHGLQSPQVFRGEMATLAVHELLRAKASGWSDVAGANVFDADGVLINSSQSWPVADVHISDRSYFNRLKADASLQEEIEVVSGRFGGKKAIVFALRISGLHGEFLGVVTRAITPDQLEAFFASTGLGDEATIAIHHRNGQMLARFPQRREPDRRKFPQRVAGADRGVRSNVRDEPACKPGRWEGPTGRVADDDDRALGRGRQQDARFDARHLAFSD
jgi:hypothetical protein